MLGSDRVIVSERAGTTRDPVDTEAEVDGERIVLVDTAGLRRRGKVAGTVGYYAQMLRPGQALKLPVRSPAMVFHVIEGGVDVRIEDQGFTLAEADTCCTPGYGAVTLRNRSASAPAFIFIADETPLHRKLGVFENRG